ncbi:DUF2867 domain-containing protein [Streptomyces sp. NPDC059009]|uniref:DUF2867 domain-containing protein n=1 Tax=Streptomyces sp. NPDC059009 TaxID=3346694 RepID=UPI00368EF128
MSSLRLPATDHTHRAWRVHEIAGDFRLEDVWMIPTPGGPDDLHHLVEQIAADGDEKPTGADAVGRFLFAVRWKLGALLGWDGPESGVGDRVATLRDRLPDDLREGSRGPDSAPFTSIFQTHDEWAAEYANKTMHGVMHIGWVPDGHGGYRGQMAVLVRPNGRLGSLYMLGIKPFRYLGVYPALMRQAGREWRQNETRRRAAH